MEQVLAQIISIFTGISFFRETVSTEEAREEMKLLKRDYPEMSFFAIQTFEDRIEKREILEYKTREKKTINSFNPLNQLSLFN